MALSDCDPGTGVLGVDASYLVPGMVIIGTTLVQGSVKIPALLATWTAISNPYVLNVEVEYVAQDGSGGTQIASANKADLKMSPTSGIVAGKTYLTRYRAVGLGTVGPWSAQSAKAVPADFQVASTGSILDIDGLQIFTDIATRGAESRENALAIARRARDAVVKDGPDGLELELAFLNGERLGTVATRKFTALEAANTVTLQYFNLMGHANDTQSAWIWDLDKIMVSPTQTAASRFAEISAKQAQNSGAITSLQQVVVDNNGALVQSVSSLSLNVTTNYVTNGSLASTVSTINGSISSEATLRVSGDGANATLINNVNLRVNDNVIDISNLVSADLDINGRMTGRWGVTIDINGSVAGVQLMSQGGGGTTISSFIVRADRFAVYTSGSAIAAFEVVGSAAYTAGNLIRTASVIDNAISTLISAYTAGSITINAGEQTLQTISFTSTGKPLKIQASTSPATRSNDFSRHRLYRDGTLLIDVPGFTSSCMTITITDSPAAGAYTYTLRSLKEGSGDHPWNNRFLSVEETRK